MRSIRLCAMLIAGIVSLAATPSFAASPITNAFKANVEANIDFLDRSARLALDKTKTAVVRDYARGAVAEAGRTADALGRVMPADLAVASPRDSEALMTGRSVAIDGVKPVAGQAANGRAPMGEKDLAALARLDGRKFDDAFWLKQLDALSQLRADYQSYADDGDDPALAALSETELTRVEQRLALLAKI